MQTIPTDEPSIFGRAEESEVPQESFFTVESETRDSAERRDGRTSRQERMFQSARIEESRDPGDERNSGTLAFLVCGDDHN